MKNESGQEVPQGIVAFKRLVDGKIFQTNNLEASGHKEWVEWSLYIGHTIHTIEVEGKQYSVGDRVENPNRPNEVFTIEKLEYESAFDFWKLCLKEGGYINHRMATKLPSPDSREPQVDSDNPIWVKGYLKGVDDAISKAKIQAVEATPQPPEGREENYLPVPIGLWEGYKELIDYIDENLLVTNDIIDRHLRIWDRNKPTPPAPQLPSQSPPAGSEVDYSESVVRSLMIDFGYYITVGKGKMLAVLRKGMPELLHHYLNSEEYKNKYHDGE